MKHDKLSFLFAYTIYLHVNYILAYLLLFSYLYVLYIYL